MRMTPALIIMLLAGSLFAYDADKAAMFNAFYKNFNQKNLAASTLFMDAEEAVTAIRENKPLFFLDVRTEGEAAVAGLNLPNSAFVPLEKLFEKAHLDALPSDKTIVIVCHSGIRATMAATSLKMAGIGNVRVLKGGLSALALAATPATAPLR